MFELDDELVLMPEVTNYVRAMGAKRLGGAKLWYVARCFRAETTTDATRLREFLQIGVELLADKALDAHKVVRRDAIKLISSFLPDGTWKLVDGVQRGLNLYDESGKTFEIEATSGGREILGGGPYDGGAGWALGLERLLAIT